MLIVHIDIKQLHDGLFSKTNIALKTIDSFFKKIACQTIHILQLEWSS